MRAWEKNWGYVESAHSRMGVMAERSYGKFLGKISLHISATGITSIRNAMWEGGVSYIILIPAVFFTPSNLEDAGASSM